MLGFWEIFVFFVIVGIIIFPYLMKISAPPPKRSKKSAKPKGKVIDLDESSYEVIEED